MITHLPGAISPAFAVLARWMLEHAEPLINAAALLGGAGALRRTARLLEQLCDAHALTPRLDREVDELLGLLSLDAVDDPGSLEAALFARIDPASPAVEEICLLTDGLRRRLHAARDAAAAETVRLPLQSAA